MTFNKSQSLQIKTTYLRSSFKYALKRINPFRMCISTLLKLTFFVYRVRSSRFLGVAFHYNKGQATLKYNPSPLQRVKNCKTFERKLLVVSGCLFLPNFLTLEWLSSRCNLVNLIYKPNIIEQVKLCCPSYFSHSLK